MSAFNNTALSDRLSALRQAMGREDYYPALQGWITSAAERNPTETVTAALARFADCMESKQAISEK